MQYACLSCRKVFKRYCPYFPFPAQKAREPRCPQCGVALQRMGTAFRAPRHDDLRGWRRVAYLTRNGFAFYRNTGTYPESFPEMRAFVDARRERSKGEVLAKKFKTRRR